MGDHMLKGMYCKRFSCSEGNVLELIRRLLYMLHGRCRTDRICAYAGWSYFQGLRTKELLEPTSNGETLSREGFFLTTSS